MPNSSPDAILRNATSVHMVGPRAREVRPVSKLIGKAMTYGLVATLAYAAWSVFPNMSSDPTSAPSVEKEKASWTVASEAPATSAATRRHAAPISAAPAISVPVSSTAAPAPIPQPPAAVSKAAPAYNLPITVTPKDTVPSLAMKMWRADEGFQALALQAEGLETSPYYIEGDSAQPSIGVGYNIKMSQTAIGASGVRRELHQAGIPDDQIALLMSTSKAQSSQARITTPQALALLDIATIRFEESTRHAVGSRAYDDLPAHRQAALMWIDYNGNIRGRPNLLSAVRAGDTAAAIGEMETWGTVNGKRVLNSQTVLAQTMYYSPVGYRTAVMDPQKIRRAARSSNEPWLAIDPQRHVPVAAPQSAPSIVPDDQPVLAQRIDAAAFADLSAQALSQRQSLSERRAAAQTQTQDNAPASRPRDR